MKTLVIRLTMSFAVLLVGAAFAQAAEELDLVDMNADGIESRFTPSGGEEGQVSVRRDTTAPGVILTIKPGKAEYPGVQLKPEGAAWDLSAYGHVEARVTNRGSKNAGLSLRLDNPGDWQKNPTNTEQVWLKPGETKTLSVIFGYAYGKKKAYPLKPDQINNLLLFAGKSDVEQSFRIEYLRAAGPAGEKPAVDPKSIRITPENGVILGQGVTFDAEKQASAAGAAKAEMSGSGLRVTFSGGKEDAITIKPPQGKWYLGAANQIRVKVRNGGDAPIVPTLVATSDDNGSTDKIKPEPLAPGAAAEIVIPFTPAVPWKGAPATDKPHQTGLPGTGTKFRSDAVGGIKLTAGGAGRLEVESIVAELGVAAPPEWVGKRPPVEGDWVLTFEENFDSDTLDLKKWNNEGPNYWDKTSHWSKANAILGDGVMRLRYEKKTGHHNDDPSQKQSDYASGYLDTYGKWVQRYGYFEARMKLPTSPGVWPAFWLMPDRGVAAGPQWVRQDTKNGGMEFDIMEHLARWGPGRYNIAMHWDGYDKNHKATGSTAIYVPSVDKDGFITAGLLWLPGQAVFYCQGQEVARWEDPRISNVQSDMMFTMPRGGWDNNAIDDAKLPADFVIDYVRVWQRKDLASDVDGYPSPAPTAEAK